MKYLKNSWIIPLVMIGFVSMFYFVRRNQQRFLRDYNEVSLETSIESRISNILVKKSVSYIRLESGEGFYLWGAKNCSYNPCYLHNFLKVGDSISKKSYSDTIYLYRGEKKYIFALSRYLNE